MEHSLQFDPDVDFWEIYRRELSRKGELEKWHIDTRNEKQIESSKVIQPEVQENTEVKLKVAQLRKQKRNFIEKEKKKYKQAVPFESRSVFTEAALKELPKGLRFGSLKDIVPLTASSSSILIINVGSSDDEFDIFENIDLEIHLSKKFEKKKRKVAMWKLAAKNAIVEVQQNAAPLVEEPPQTEQESSANKRDLWNDPIGNIEKFFKPPEPTMIVQGEDKPKVEYDLKVKSTSIQSIQSENKPGKKPGLVAYSQSTIKALNKSSSIPPTKKIDRKKQLRMDQPIHQPITSEPSIEEQKRMIELALLHQKQKMSIRIGEMVCLHIKTVCIPCSKI